MGITFQEVGGVYGGHTHLKNCEKMHELRCLLIYYECVLREFMLLGLWSACEHAIKPMVGLHEYFQL